MLFDVILLSFLNFLDLLFYFEFCVVCFFSSNTTFRLCKGLVYLKKTDTIKLINSDFLYIFFLDALRSFNSYHPSIRSLQITKFFQVGTPLLSILIKKNHVKVYFFFNVGVRISLRTLITRAMKLTTI